MYLDKGPFLLISNGCQGVYRVCEMVTDLSRAPDFLWTPRRISKKKRVCTFIYDLCLTIKSAELLFELNALGTNYGTVTANFE